MKVYYNYLSDEFKNVDHIIKDWKLLIKSSDFTLGKYVEKFEKKFENYVGVDNCISTNNGTDALILSLKALGICAGDEVITVANTFYATVGAIVAVGATPVLVDADERFQISIDSIEEAITKHTKAVIPVHWGGASPNIYGFQIQEHYYEQRKMYVTTKLSNTRVDCAILFIIESYNIPYSEKHNIFLAPYDSM